MKRPSRVFAISLLVVAMVSLTTPGCSSFDTQQCGDKYLHVAYGESLTGYRLVALTESPQLELNVSGVADWDKWEAWKNEPSPKVAFEHNSPLAVSCGERIEFTSNTEPAVNTMAETATTNVVASHELLYLDSSSYDVLIR